KQGAQLEGEIGLLPAEGKMIRPTAGEGCLQDEALTTPERGRELVQSRQHGVENVGIELAQSQDRRQIFQGHAGNGWLQAAPQMQPVVGTEILHRATKRLADALAAARGRAP